MTTAIGDIREYLDACLGDSQGRLHVATGAGPRLSDAGRYEHTQWAETRFAWPIEADQAAREIFAVYRSVVAIDACPSSICTARRLRVPRNGDAWHLRLEGVLYLLLKTSFSFSPALLRLAFAWSPLPCL